MDFQFRINDLGFGVDDENCFKKGVLCGEMVKMTCNQKI
jgi:hypothetical protein